MPQRKPSRAPRSAPATIAINRAPVLTLWAAVVAERLGYDRDEALTLGRAVAGLNAATKAGRLGLARTAKPGEPYGLKPRAAAAALVIELLGRHVPVVKTKDGIRAAKDGKPDAPASVQRYLESKFGESLGEARAAMAALARAFDQGELAECAFGLYEQFRPSVPEGTRGWGAKGVLDLGLVRRLGEER